MTAYRAHWPVLDVDRTRSQLIAEADPQLHDLLVDADLTAASPVTWSITWDQPDGVHLVAELAVTSAAPSATHAHGGRRVHLDDVEWLLQACVPLEEIADRCGVRPDALEAACRRHGRPDLWARLTRHRRSNTPERTRLGYRTAA